MNGCCGNCVAIVLLANIVNNSNLSMSYINMDINFCGVKYFMDLVGVLVYENLLNFINLRQFTVTIH